MRAGLLTEQIEFYRPITIKTDTGSEDVIFEPSIKCRAYVTHKSGNRINDNGDVFFTKGIVFQVRRFWEFNELFRIKYKGRDYQITYIEYNAPQQAYIINAELLNNFEIEHEEWQPND